MNERLSPAVIHIKRQALTEEGMFQGYASTWDGQPDSYGDIIKKGAFLRALAKHKQAGTYPAMLWGHDQKEIVGVWTHIEEDNVGLLASGKLMLETTKGKEAYQFLKAGAIGLSIGFSLAKGGSRYEGGIRYITDIERLYEISLVSVPANASARITDVKKPETRKEFERLLRTVAGFSVRESKKIAACGFGNLACNEQQTDLGKVLEEIKALRSDIQEGNNL